MGVFSKDSIFVLFAIAVQKIYDYIAEGQRNHPDPDEEEDEDEEGMDGLLLIIAYIFAIIFHGVHISI